MHKLIFPRAACLQFEVVEADIEANLRQVRAMVEHLAPAPDTLIVLPELWAHGFAYRHIASLARQTTDILACLGEIAAESGVYFAGSLLEQTEDTGDIYNTLHVQGPEGVLGTYRKQHLFSFWREDAYFRPGRGFTPIATPHGLLGGLVCYDLRFPELARDQAFAGCRLLVVSAEWPMARLDHWQCLVRARAIENQLFVVACNCGGRTGNIDFAGHSLIVAPDGRVLAEAGSGVEAIRAELEREELDTLRSRFCSVGERPLSGDDQRKVVSLAELREQLACIRAQGAKVAFTNGCFDIPHAGHVDYLQQARQTADCLVVGLNSDRSVRALKGETRPVNSEQERARVLAALGCVDFVVVFDEDTPHGLITAIMPEVLVKGADWPEEQIVGAVEVKESGGRVARIPFAHQVSTTALIDRIQGK